MKVSSQVVNTLGLFCTTASLAYAHSGPVPTGPHVVEHLIPVFAAGLAAVWVARVLWLKRHRDS